MRINKLIGVASETAIFENATFLNVLFGLYSFRDILDQSMFPVQVLVILTEILNLYAFVLKFIDLKFEKL